MTVYSVGSSIWALRNKEHYINVTGLKQNIYTNLQWIQMLKPRLILIKYFLIVEICNLK